jgi:NAD(P)-dependent dehydrogenase (short-subunit alcohol dehydrogenase family)
MIAHLSYVLCDACGLPASQPEDDARAARRMIPGDWDMGPPKGTPLGRHGVPKDVGPAVVYFASDEASWVTGQILSVNGGVYRNV